MIFFFIKKNYTLFVKEELYNYRKIIILFQKQHENNFSWGVEVIC